jgi:hypothetical protein
MSKQQPDWWIPSLVVLLWGALLLFAWFAYETA